MPPGPPADLATAPDPAPRVLIIVPDHWPRALLRATLRELGYDAVGARDLGDALAYPAAEPGRGPVRLVILDQRALAETQHPLVAQLMQLHGDPLALLLAPGARPPAGGSWTRVIRRPVTIGELVEAIRAMLPLAATHPANER
jgi:hypothetical protein